MKSIVLLSGGLDSVVTAHHVAKELGESLVGILFDYGQVTVDRELSCARKTIEKLREEGYEAELKICSLNTLANKTSLGGNGDSEEIPLRNLEFIVRAARLAKQIGADRIFAGFINPMNPDGSRYADTTPEFVEKLNAVTSLFGVELYAPFVNHSKTDIGFLAKYYGIDVIYDTWSCNYPIGVYPNIEECGKCDNCNFRNNYHVNFPKSLNEIWFEHGFEMSDAFRKAYMNEKVTEARLMVNSSCNMSCKHCYYGFENGKTVSPELKLDEWHRIIDQLVDFGIERFHMSGKEPLLNHRIFRLTDYIKKYHPHIEYEVVTNGKTVEKLYHEIINAGFKRVVLSFESFDEDYIRENYALKSLKLLQGKVPLAVYVDVHKGTAPLVKSNLTRLYNELGIRDFWVRPIYYYGEAEGITDSILDNEMCYQLYKDVKEMAAGMTGAKVSFHVKDSFIEGMLPLDEAENGTLADDVTYIMKTGDDYISDNMFMYLQMFCTKYGSQITVQSDGWMLGCGVEVCHSNYDQRSAGSLRNESVLDIVRRGKERTLDLIIGNLSCRTKNGCNVCAGGCTSKNYCYNFQSAELNPFGEH
jgi:7-cyano-7-deazaguanine synthase in queuosine biosynthesis/MoaA/NifB/PqqE/SkfB family radical SAM enzyme